jgi:hypothetical protein
VFHRVGKPRARGRDVCVAQRNVFAGGCRARRPLACQLVDGSVSDRARAVSYAKMHKNANHYDPNAGFDAQSINESLHATDTRRNDNFYRDRANLLLKLDENGKV